MNTLARRILSTSAVIAATAAITSTALSQADDPYEQDMKQQVDEMMARWMELAEPRPQHARLMKRAGQWKQKMTHWPYPGAEPTESISHVTSEPILGGRFLKENVHGSMLVDGQRLEFDGIGIFGYDNLDEKHTFIWLDSMGTMFMTGRGEANETGNTITYFSTMTNPMTGQPMRIKTIYRHFNDNEYGMQMYEDLGDDTWHKSMELVASRK